MIRFFFKSVLAFVLLLLMSGFAFAELRMTMKPDSVTAKTTSAVVIEISSLRLNVTIIHPDAQLRDGATVLDGILGQAPDYDLSTAKQMVAEYYTMGLVNLGEKSLAATIKSERLSLTSDIFKIVEGINQQAWLGVVEGGTLIGPPPELVFVIELDLPGALAVKHALSKVAEAQVAPNAGTFSLLDYHKLAVGWLDVVLSSSRMDEVQISSQPRYIIEKLIPKAITPLGWMFEAMIDLSQREIAAASGRPLSGCTFQAKHKITQLSVASSNSVERFYSALVADERWQDIFSFTDFKSQIEWAEYGRNSNPMNAPARIVARAGVKFSSAGWLRKFFSDKLGDLADSPDYMTAVLSGRIDPAVIDIYDCASQLRNRGVRLVHGSIFERKIAYRRMNTDLSDRIATAPKFFKAAETVTSLIGIGFVDVVELGNIDEFSKFAKIADDPFIDQMCTKLGGDASFLPGSQARAILRQINAELYSSVNMPVYARLRDLPRDVTVFQMPDPVTGKTLDSDLHPMFAGLSNTSVPHDLRMVIAEQSYIERELPKLLDTSTADGKKVLEELDRAQSALFCLQLDDVLTSTQDQAHRKTLKRTWELMSAVLGAKLIAKEDANFSNYWWRVAIGSAMVMALHGRDDDEEYLNYLRQLIKLEADKGFKSPPEDITPHQLERMRVLLNKDLSSLGAAEEGLRRGAEILLADDFADTEFWTCENDSPVQRTLNAPGSQEQRLAAIVRSGGHILSIAYELGPDGALDAGAKPNDGNAGTCEAFLSRRARLEAAVSALVIPIPAAEGSIERPLIIFERSIAMRKKLGQLAPFIASAKSTFTPSTGIDRIMALVKDANEREQIYARRITLLDILGPGGKADKAHQNILHGLEIKPTDFAQVETLYASLHPDVGEVLAEGENSEAYLSAYNSDPAQKAVAKLEPMLAEVFNPLETAWHAEVSQFGPIQLAATRFPVQPFFPNGQSDFITVGAGLGDALLAGLGLPGLVGLTTTQTGSFPDGSAKYHGELVMRLPSIRALASMGVTGQCDVTVTAKDGAGQGCATETILGDRNTVTSNDLISLGLFVRNLSLAPDCDIKKPPTCVFTREVLIDEDSVGDVSAIMAKTLRRLGLPGFVTFEPNELSFGNATLNDIVVKGKLTVANIKLDSIIDVPLRVDGKWQDFSSSFIKAVSEAIDLQLAKELGKATDFMASLRQPSSDAAYQASLVRFGPARDEDGSPDIEIALNWERAALSLRMIYALEVRLSKADPWSDALAVRAGVELSFGEDGVSSQRIVFEKPGKKEVMDRIAALPVFKTVKEATGGTLAVTPEVKGGKLHLRITFEAEVAGCPLEAPISLPIDQFDAFEDELKVVSEMLLNQAGGCLAKPLVKQFETLLADKSVDILGVPFAISLGENLLQDVIDQNLPLTFTLQETALGADAVLGSCEALAGQRDVEGIKFKTDPLKFDFRDMSDEAERLLGIMVGCRVERLVPEGLNDHFELGKVAVGHDLLAADIILNDLPMIGTLALPRQNFVNLDSDLGEVLKNALGGAVSAEVKDKIYKHMGGSHGLDIAGLGRITLNKESLTLDLFGGDPKLISDVTILSYGMSITGQLELAFNRGLDALRITVDEDAAMVGVVRGIIGKALDYIPQETIEIKNPRFGRLDDMGREWGLVFGMTAKIPLEPGLLIGASRITISESGVKLGEKITGGISTPIYLGPVALSKILISLYTGENGHKSGVEIGADLTVFEPQLAHLVKLRALLDLSEIDVPKFTVTGDLVVLSSIDIFKSTGVLDLSQLRATLDAKTTDALKDILKYDIDLVLDGGDLRFLAKSGLSVLGVELDKTNLAFCIKACDDGTGREHIAELTVMKRFLIGKGNVHAITDLDFSDPNLGAGVDLNLFGWKPGGAKLDADLTRVNVGLRFLGLDLQAQTPSVKTMTPQLLIDMLKSLFDLSLEDLLKIKPDNISISLMAGDGSTQTVHNGSESGENDRSAQSSDGTGMIVEVVGEAEGGALPPEPGEAPPQGNGESAPDQTPWGRTAQANVCEKLIGTPKSKTLTDALEARFYISSVYRDEQIEPAFRNEIRKPGGRSDWWHLYSFATADTLCDSGGNSNFVLTKNVVGVDREWQWVYGCGDEQPPSYIRKPVPKFDVNLVRAEPVKGLVNLSTQLACARTPEWRGSIWGTWYVDTSEPDAPEYLIAPHCPSGAALANLVAADEGAARVCSGGVLRVPAKGIGNFFDAPDVLDADTLYRLNVTYVRPWIEGKDTPYQFTKETAFAMPSLEVLGQTFAVALWREANAEGEALNWHFMLSRALENGAKQVLPMVLSASDPLAEFRSKPSVMAYVLKLWLEQDQRPEVLAQNGDTFLVIGATQNSETGAAAQEEHVWLWQQRPEAHLSTRNIIFPLRVPLPGVLKKLAAGRTDPKQSILMSLWPEIQRLPEEPASWELVLGLNSRKLSQSFAFVAQTEDDDPVVHLLLNRLEEKIFDPARLWDGSRTPAGEVASSRDDRRRCTTWSAIATSLGAYRSPKRSTAQMTTSVRQALSAPTIYNLTANALRDLPEPLVALPTMTCPEP